MLLSEIQSTNKDNYLRFLR